MIRNARLFQSGLRCPAAAKISPIIRRDYGRSDRPQLYRARLDIDFGGKRLMNGTSVRNLHKLTALLVSKRPSEMNLSLDLVDLSLFGLALSAVDRMNFRVRQGNSHTLEWPASSASIKRDRH